MTNPLRSFRLHHLALAIVLPVLSGATGPCASPANAIDVEFFESLTITAATSTSTGDCIPSGTKISAGILDVDRGNCCGYSAGVEMINTLPAQTDPNTPPLAVDERSVTIQSVSVKYHFIPNVGSPSVTLRDETFPVTAVIKSGQGTADFISPVLSVSNGSVLNPPGGTPATGTLVATMTFSGPDKAGDIQTAPPVQFPIQVCQDCLPTLTCMANQTIQVCTADSLNQVDGAICGG